MSNQRDSCSSLEIGLVTQGRVDLGQNKLCWTRPARGGPLFVRHLGGDSEQADRYKELRRQVWAKSGQNWTLKLGQGSSKRRIKH